jgi:hypothetical protein
MLFYFILFYILSGIKFLLPFLISHFHFQFFSKIAIDIIGLVGYQRLAMQIIGGLQSPVNKAKVPLSWLEILALVVELRLELGLSRSCDLE